MSAEPPDGGDIDKNVTDDISVVAESDEDSDEDNLTSVISDKDLSGDAGQLSYSDILFAPTQPRGCERSKDLAGKPVRQELTESVLRSKAVQAVDSRLSDSALLYAPTQAVENQLSESELLYAPTQAVANSKLSDSELLGASTQAVTNNKLSDSELMSASTQTLTKNVMSESELLYAPTQVVANSKLSESELFYASTQAVTKNKLSDSELSCVATQNIDADQMHKASDNCPPITGRDKSGTSVLEMETESLLEGEMPPLLETETQSLLEAETQSVMLAEAHHSIVKDGIQPDADKLDETNFLEAETQPLLANEKLGALIHPHDSVSCNKVDKPEIRVHEPENLPTSEQSKVADQTESLDLQVAETQSASPISELTLSPGQQLEDGTDTAAAVPKLVRTSTQKSSSEEGAEAAANVTPAPSVQSATTKPDMFQESRPSGSASAEPELFTDSNLSLIPSTQSQDDYCATRNPVEDNSDDEDGCDETPLDISNMSENLLLDDDDNMGEDAQGEAVTPLENSLLCNSPIVGKTRNETTSVLMSQTSESMQESCFENSHRDHIEGKRQMSQIEASVQPMARPSFLSQQINVEDKESTTNYSSMSMIETSLRPDLSKILLSRSKIEKKRLAQTNYSAVSMLESSIEPRANARLLSHATKSSATDYASMSMDQTAVAESDILLKPTGSPVIRKAPAATTPQKTDVLAEEAPAATTPQKTDVLAEEAPMATTGRKPTAVDLEALAATTPQKAITVDGEALAATTPQKATAVVGEAIAATTPQKAAAAAEEAAGSDSPILSRSRDGGGSQIETLTSSSLHLRFSSSLPVAADSPVFGRRGDSEPKMAKGLQLKRLEADKVILIPKEKEDDHGKHLQESAGETEVEGEVDIPTERPTSASRNDMLFSLKKKLPTSRRRTPRKWWLFFVCF